MSEDSASYPKGDNRTIKDLARNALDVQDACNLSGVVHSFSRDITRLRAILEQEPNFSTDKLNRHPICILYTNKLDSLAKAGYGEEYSKAYNWAKDCLDLDCFDKQVDSLLENDPDMTPREVVEAIIAS